MCAAALHVAGRVRPRPCPRTIVTGRRNGLRPRRAGGRAAGPVAGADRRQHRRGLPGRVHQRPRRPRRRPTLLQDARRRRTPHHRLAHGVRRRGRVHVGPDRRARGDVGPPRAPGRAVHGSELGRPGDHGLRERRAEAAAPVRHRGGGRHLVPGVQRARGRQRPGLTPHPGGGGRRRLAHHRAEDLDLVRRHGAVVRAGRSRRSRGAARGHHDVPRPDGHARHHRAPDPLDARPSPPQRGVLRRGLGRPRRRARRDRRGLGRHPQGAGPRACRHRPLRALRAAAVGARQGAGPALGRPTSVAARPVGTGARAGARRPPPRVPNGARAGDRRVPRRARVGGAHRGHPVRPVGGRGAVPGRRGRRRSRRAQARRCTVPSRTTGATPRRPRSRPAPSRCSG